MKTAVYPGSFDPVTLGHLDILERAAQIFDTVIIAVMQNRHKNCWFTAEQRVELLEKSIAYIPNVTIESSELLLADYCKTKGDVVLVKGLRAISDFEREFQMALINRKMNPTLDTLFLTAGERFQYLSSSVIKEVSVLGGDVSDFIPRAIHDDVLSRAYRMTNEQNRI